MYGFRNKVLETAIKDIRLRLYRHIGTITPGCTMVEIVTSATAEPKDLTFDSWVKK